MQMVYGLIHAAYQLQSQLGLPIFMPTFACMGHLHHADGQTTSSAGRLSQQTLRDHQQQTGSYSRLDGVSERVGEWVGGLVVEY